MHFKTVDTFVFASTEGENTMKKHYVVLEFTPEHQGDVKGIPWANLLAGGVKVSNHQYITPKDAEGYENVQECINALQDLYYEATTSDGFNPNLEGSEHAAEQRAQLALQNLNLL